MPAAYSVYSVDESGLPEWLPGEALAASAFLAMALLLVVEINVQIHRVFKYRRGVYFWAMQVGSLGCAVDALAVMLKNLVPHSTKVWPLYTLMATTGWAVYTVAQLVVLYSRLHLVSHSQRIQKCVLYIIVVVSPILIVTDWTTTWPAWNPTTSDHWSPAEAIVERIAQLGFSTVEVMINIIYAVSIVRLLKPKSSVRQRRVMLDLLYVNILAVLFDILNIVLVYVNRIGVSHPVQVFSYALKLRLEFIVLNQLMAVAARGHRRETFEELRYHHRPGVGENWDGDVSKFLGKNETKAKDEESDRRQSSTTTGISKPSRSIPPPIFMAPFRSPKVEHKSRSFLFSPSPSKDRSPKSSPTRLRPPFGNAFSKGARSSKDRYEESALENANKRPSTLTRNDEDEPEEEEIGLHEWERQASHNLEVPWLSRSPCL
ncbi:MAG: hypothetical protein Q9195_004623 [Heterodermia aff. obscurata]